MIDFESSGTSESNEAVEESVAFIIDFEAINESEIIVIDLINRFFSHCFGLYFQPKTVLLIKGDINCA